MSEKEKQIMNTIIEGLPKMSEFEKGYVLGIIETKVTDKEQIFDTYEELINKPSTFTFYKYDEYNNLIDGAEFKLQKLDDNKKIATLRAIQGVMSIPYSTRAKITAPILNKLIDDDVDADELTKAYNKEKEDLKIDYGEF